jgi:hypothetical protein
MVRNVIKVIYFITKIIHGATTFSIMTFSRIECHGLKLLRCVHANADRLNVILPNVILLNVVASFYMQIYILVLAASPIKISDQWLAL